MTGNGRRVELVSPERGEGTATWQPLGSVSRQRDGKCWALGEEQEPSKRRGRWVCRSEGVKQDLLSHGRKLEFYSKHRERFQAGD